MNQTRIDIFSIYTHVYIIPRELQHFLSVPTTSWMSVRIDCECIAPNKIENPILDMFWLECAISSLRVKSLTPKPRTLGTSTVVQQESFWKNFKFFAELDWCPRETSTLQETSCFPWQYQCNFRGELGVLCAFFAERLVSGRFSLHASSFACQDEIWSTTDRGTGNLFRRVDACLKPMGKVVVTCSNMSRG